MSLYYQLVQHIANELTQEPKAISRDHLHANQVHILENQNRFNVLVCGRRFGKTTVALQALKEYAAQGKRIWWTAQTYKAVNKVWRYLVKEYRHENISHGMQEIYLSNGGYIGVRSLKNFDNLRSEGLEVVFVDEAAFVSPDAWFDVLDPMLLDGGENSIAWFMCNPKGLNWFYDLYKLGIDDTQSEWVSFHYTSYDNPLIPASEIDKRKKRIPSRKFAEEYLAEFNDSDGAVFRNVRACATASEQMQPVEGHNYIFSCDFARDNDYTVITVLDVNTAEMVYMDRYNHVDYMIQQRRITSLYQKWKPLQVIAESNSIGAPMIDALRREGIPIKAFQTTAKSKPLIIDSLALAFEQESIKILNHPILIHELTSYEQTKTASGNMKFSAPEGGHDDTVVSLAIGWNYISRRTADEIPVISF